jgi:uncharacterized protein DUF2842
VTAPAPSGRALGGIVLLLLLIALLALLVASVSRAVGSWPILLQALFYIVVVIVWTVMLKPLVRWIVTGRFRAPRRAARD